MKWLVFFFCSLCLAGCGDDLKRNARMMTGGKPDAGKEAIENKGCASCHTIPGIRSRK